MDRIEIILVVAVLLHAIMYRYSYKSILCSLSIGRVYREKRRKGDCGEYGYSEYEVLVLTVRVQSDCYNNNDTSRGGGMRMKSGEYDLGCN